MRVAAKIPVFFFSFLRLIASQTQIPTYLPTSSPTITPTPVSAIVHAYSTIALHQIVSVKSTASQLIRLSSFDTSAQKVSYKIYISMVVIFFL
jgi:hypothetical protein